MHTSTREKHILIELLVSVLVSAYYFYGSYQLSGWTQIIGSEMAALISKVIVIAIVASIVLYAIFSRATLEDRDERDLAINGKAHAFAYYSLVGLCSCLVGLVMFNEGLGLMGNNIQISGPLAMHFILMALMVSGIVKSAVQLLCYRLS
ncbi:hypothetical protein U062_02187 [Gammaproteobacteria bacterium MOLA455]|nr:hypothetical protein U062_02187 [Gammaproteobacteria bacterium MOLA455]